MHIISTRNKIVRENKQIIIIIIIIISPKSLTGGLKN